MHSSVVPPSICVHKLHTSPELKNRATDTPLSANSFTAEDLEFVSHDVESPSPGPTTILYSPISSSTTHVRQPTPLPVSPMTKTNIRWFSSNSLVKSHTNMLHLLSHGSYADLTEPEQEDQSDMKVQLNIQIKGSKRASLCLPMSSTPPAAAMSYTTSISDTSSDATESTWCVLDDDDLNMTICKDNARASKSTFPYPTKQEILQFNHSQRCHNKTISGVNSNAKLINVGVGVGQDFFHDIYHIQAWKQQAMRQKTDKSSFK